MVRGGRKRPNRRCCCHIAALPTLLLLVVALLHLACLPDAAAFVVAARPLQHRRGAGTRQQAMGAEGMEETEEERQRLDAEARARMAEHVKRVEAAQ